MHKLYSARPLYPLLGMASALLVVIAGLLSIQQTGYPVWLLLFCLIYCAFGFSSATAKCLLIFIPVSLIFGGFSFLFNRDLTIMLQMTLRVLTIGIASVPVVTLPPVNLTRCLNQLHCPRMITLGMLVAIRFIPVLTGEIRQIREAMKTRGASTSWWNPGCFYRAFLIPLMVRVISISETLSLSLEVRAFDLEDNGATVYRSVHFNRRDFIYLLLLLILLTGMVVLS